MAIDAVVKQIDSRGSIVVECTAVQECMRQNPGLLSGQCKKCLLSVNHGDRCVAYPQDSNTFLIDNDVSRIKQLPTK